MKQATAAHRFPDPTLRAQCARFLSGHGAMTPRSWTERLASSSYLDLGPDEYNEGPAMQRLEDEVAQLLGKEAALFFHKGVVAQQAVLLVHAAQTNRRVVALHPKSHIAFDEQDALDRLAGLSLLRIGSDARPFKVADLDSIAEPLAALTIELPLRRAAFQVPSWDELIEIALWARDRNVPFHLDGARLWEIQPHFGRQLSEIAAIADTVYVSFYKGLGGMGGCVLAGPRTTIEATKSWRSRFGGSLYSAFPYVLTALDGLQRHLPRMGIYYRHAGALAVEIGRVPGVTVLPAPPQSNSFQVHFSTNSQTLEKVATDIARERGWWLFNRFTDAAFPDTAFGEITVGEATLGWTPAEAAAAVAELNRRGASA